MPTLPVSFKSTKKEMDIFEFVNNLEKQEKSEFVKKALEYYISYLKSINKIK